MNVCNRTKFSTREFRQPRVVKLSYPGIAYGIVRFPIGETTLVCNNRPTYAMILERPLAVTIDKWRDYERTDHRGQKRLARYLMATGAREIRERSSDIGIGVKDASARNAIWNAIFYFIQCGRNEVAWNIETYSDITPVCSRVWAYARARACVCLFVYIYEYVMYTIIYNVLTSTRYVGNIKRRLGGARASFPRLGHFLYLNYSWKLLGRHLATNVTRDISIKLTALINCRLLRAISRITS